MQERRQGTVVCWGHQQSASPCHFHFSVSSEISRLDGICSLLLFIILLRSKWIVLYISLVIYCILGQAMIFYWLHVNIGRNHARCWEKSYWRCSGHWSYLFSLLQLLFHFSSAWFTVSKNAHKLCHLFLHFLDLHFFLPYLASEKIFWHFRGLSLIFWRQKYDKNLTLQNSHGHLPVVEFFSPNRCQTKTKWYHILRKKHQCNGFSSISFLRDDFLVPYLRTSIGIGHVIIWNEQPKLKKQKR